MLHFDFMQHAFLAGTMVAVMCGVLGVFVMARGLSFISHAFSDIGFAGAAFAVFMGWDPLLGLLLFTIFSSVAIGSMGVRVFRRDASVSVILSVFLGLGILFLSLSLKQANSATSILFGSIVGIRLQEVWEVAVLCIFILLLIGLGYRRLKFDSFDPAGSRAAGLPVRLISVGFLILLAMGVSVTVQIIGALLVFALLTVPASAARYFTSSVSGMIRFAVLFAVSGIWGDWY